jgi:hypothetical protein
MFCLVKEKADLFLNKIRSGELNPEKMSSMTSKERRDYFSKFMGEEDAKQVNTIFETKLLLKDQQRGMISWAEQVGGLKPQVKKDLISKINKMDKILTPETEKAFLEDLAEHKLGVTVTVSEAKEISQRAKSVSENKGKIAEDSPLHSEERLNYGRSLVEFNEYVNDLKRQSTKLTFKDVKKNPVRTALKGISNLSGLAKSLKATLDNSVIGRQGLKTLFSRPGIWAKNSAQSFVDIVRVFGGHNVMNEVKADVLSRPNALNGLYAKEKLAIGVVEEAYPTSLPEKIPGVGRVFKAAETAFTAWQYRTRADVFDKYVEIAQKTGADIEGIGKVVNSLTGRGSFEGKGEKALSAVNNVFFSPRFFKSNVDLLTVHAFDKNIGSFARKQAALNMVKTVGGIAAILAIAKAIDPKSVEEDPRSADFGKIRVGDTRFDVTGGMASIATLAMRQMRNSTKSSMTGKVTKLNTGKYGMPTRGTVLWNFFENKLSPAASVVNETWFKGKDRQGNKPTLLGETSNLLTPLPITTYLELKNNPNSAPILAALVADELGISTNTYSKKKYKPIKK